jgi:hypothetical protein
LDLSGQVLIDLGFIDEDQLWEVLEEAKSTGQLSGQVAVGRGLINDEQLLTALAEQHKCVFCHGAGLSGGQQTAGSHGPRAYSRS